MFVLRDAIDEGLPNPRGQSLANLSIAFACLSFLFVSSRILTRVFIHKAVGVDDYFIIGSMVLAICMAVSYSQEVRFGFGLHTKQVDKYHKMKAFEWFFVAQLLYKIASCLTKLSLLSLYLRIFPSRRFRIASFITIGVVVAYSFGSLCATIWQCDPIHRAWNKSVPGHCISIGGVWYGTSVMAIVTDLAIIILPINQIRKLQLPLSQKIGLCMLFSLGLFVVSCTVVRMIVVGPAISQKDTMYYQSISNSWTFLEVNVGIICACLPVMKAPIVRFFPCLMRNKSTLQQSGQLTSHAYNISGDPHSSRMISSQRKVRLDDASDEEFMLEERGVKKTTDIDVSYENVEPGKHTGLAY